MENNLNQKHIRRYSQEFAEKVCDDFFTSASAVTNDVIMTLQPIRQVNLFVVKNLFDVWQQEIRKLKSPYFEYTSGDVTEAMEKLKNALSRSIRMDRETYQPLLEKSVKETLRLILSPYDYYKDLISIEESLLTPEYLRTTSKYMKVNPFIIQALLIKLENEKAVTLDHAMAERLLDEVVEQLDSEPDDIEPHVEAFNKILPLSLGDLYGGARENTPKDSHGVSDIEQSDTEPSLENISAGEPQAADGPEKKNEAAKSEKASFRTLNDDLLREEKPTLADIHHKQKIADIRSHLTINQRFMFINSLFGGDEKRFNEVIDHIERQDTVDDAIHYLHAAYGEWDRESEEVEEFILIVRKRMG